MLTPRHIAAMRAELTKIAGLGTLLSGAKHYGGNVIQRAVGAAASTLKPAASYLQQPGRGHAVLNAASSKAGKLQSALRNVEERLGGLGKKKTAQRP